MAPPPHRDVALQLAVLGPSAVPPSGPVLYRRTACDSGLVRLDVKAWLMSALITSALLVAFGAALALRGTGAE